MTAFPPPLSLVTRPTFPTKRRARGQLRRLRLLRHRRVRHHGMDRAGLAGPLPVHDPDPGRPRGHHRELGRERLDHAEHGPVRLRRLHRLPAALLRLRHHRRADRPLGDAGLRHHRYRDRRLRRHRLEHRHRDPGPARGGLRLRVPARARTGAAGVHVRGDLRRLRLRDRNRDRNRGRHVQRDRRLRGALRRDAPGRRDLRDLRGSADPRGAPASRAARSRRAARGARAARGPRPPHPGHARDHGSARRTPDRRQDGRQRESGRQRQGGRQRRQPSPQPGEAFRPADRGRSLSLRDGRRGRRGRLRRRPHRHGPARRGHHHDGRARPGLGEAGRGEHQARHPTGRAQRRRGRLRGPREPHAGAHRPARAPGRGKEEEGGGGRSQGGRPPQVRHPREPARPQRQLRSGRRHVDVGAHRHRLPGLLRDPGHGGHRRHRAHPVQQRLREHGDSDRARRNRDLVLPPQLHQDPRRQGQGGRCDRLLGQLGQLHRPAPPLRGPARRRIRDRPPGVAAQQGLDPT